MHELFPDFKFDAALRDQAPYVFFDHSAYRSMWDHSKSDTMREHGGILVGEPYQDRGGRYFVVVRSAIAAEDAAGTPAHLQFVAESWQPVWSFLDEHPQLRMVGWYHTHPRMGVFFSRTDRRTQRAHFAQPWQIAVVIDPVDEQIAYYYGAEAAGTHHVQTFKMRRNVARLI